MFCNMTCAPAWWRLVAPPAERTTARPSGGMPCSDNFHASSCAATAAGPAATPLNVPRFAIPVVAAL